MHMATRDPPLGISNGSMLITRRTMQEWSICAGGRPGAAGSASGNCEVPKKELVIKVRELDAGRMPWTAPRIIRQHTP
jgi:hypothetical protein